MSAPTPPKRDIYSVSRLNAEIRSLLEGSFPLLWVEGEISNLVTPRSGHSYFSLKDAHAQVRCALFRNRRQLLRFQPKNGDQVLVRARLSLYEARGDFQLIVEHLEPSGEGALLRAFEALKAKLAAEGLFDSRRKRPLPPFPRQVGIITSPTGAALRDILQIMARRWPGLPVLIYPARVQGAEAPRELIRALRLAASRRECDLLILARGGGSLEDLAAFNDEALARTIAELPIPIISAVGHEIDFTIADFVADRRAPTPSAAAELATPDRVELTQRLQGIHRRLLRAAAHQLQGRRQRLGQLEHKLRLLHPQRRLQQHQQRLDELSGRLARAITRLLANRAHRLQLSEQRLGRHSPRARLQLLDSRLAQVVPRLQPAMERILGSRAAILAQARERLPRAMQRHLELKTQRLQALSHALDTVSPLQTLARGYSITQDAQGRPLSDATRVQPGDRIHTRLARGLIVSRVEGVQDEI